MDNSFYISSAHSYLCARGMLEWVRDPRTNTCCFLLRYFPLRSENAVRVGSKKSYVQGTYPKVNSSRMSHKARNVYTYTRSVFTELLARVSLPMFLIDAIDYRFI